MVLNFVRNKLASEVILRRTISSTVLRHSIYILSCGKTPTTAVPQFLSRSIDAMLSERARKVDSTSVKCDEAITKLKPVLYSRKLAKSDQSVPPRVICLTALDMWLTPSARGAPVIHKDCSPRKDSHLQVQMNILRILTLSFAWYLRSHRNPRAFRDEGLPVSLRGRRRTTKHTIRASRSRCFTCRQFQTQRVQRCNSILLPHLSITSQFTTSFFIVLTTYFGRH